jgi:hypothetical protein
MTNYELHETVKMLYNTDGYHHWLSGQPEDILIQLQAGLSGYLEATLVVRTREDSARAETHDGPVVYRDDPDDWSDYCEDMCILEDVTELLGQRLYAAVHGGARVRDDLPDARRVLSDWIRAVEDRVGRPPGVVIRYARESRAVRTSGMDRHSLPELEIHHVPVDMASPVERVLREVCDHILARPDVARLGGTMTTSNGTQFRFVPADPPREDEYRRSELWRLADVGESYLGCSQPEQAGV